MPEGDDLLTADKVAALLSVSVRTVRRYADSGRLSPVRLGRSVRYRLQDVERLIAEEADTSGQDRADSDRSRADSSQGRPGSDTGGQAPIEAAYRVTPAEVERAIERTGVRYLADMETILTRVGQVYAGQLAAKDATITTQAEMLADLRRQRDDEREREREALAELRRRADVAEAEADALRLRLAEASVHPVVIVAGQDATEAPHATATTPAAHKGVQGRWRRRRRGDARAAGVDDTRRIPRPHH